MMFGNGCHQHPCICNSGSCSYGFCDCEICSPEYYWSIRKENTKKRDLVRKQATKELELHKLKRQEVRNKRNNK